MYNNIQSNEMWCQTYSTTLHKICTRNQTSLLHFGIYPKTGPTANKWFAQFSGNHTITSVKLLCSNARWLVSRLLHDTEKMKYSSQNGVDTACDNKSNHLPRKNKWKSPESNARHALIRAAQVFTSYVLPFNLLAFFKTDCSIADR